MFMCLQCASEGNQVLQICVKLPFPSFLAFNFSTYVITYQQSLLYTVYWIYQDRHVLKTHYITVIALLSKFSSSLNKQKLLCCLCVVTSLCFFFMLVAYGRIQPGKLEEFSKQFLASLDGKQLSNNKELCLGLSFGNFKSYPLP